MALRIETIAIGDELLDGRLADTNSKHLAQEIGNASCVLTLSQVVSDRPSEIADALNRAAGRADVIVTSGGLGPTTDDRTAEAVALAAGCQLVLDGLSWENIQERFKSFGLPMPDNNRRQATVPSISQCIQNGAGVAPAFVTKLGAATIYCLPGVPKEYRWFVANLVLPAILKQMGEGKQSLFVETRTLRCIGITESALGALVERSLDESQVDGTMEGFNDNVTVQYRTAFPENHLRFLVRGTDRDAIGRQADDLAERLKSQLGPSCYGLGEATLEERLVKELMEAEQTLSVAESCTGGLLGAKLTSVAGCSDVFSGGIISYSNAIKSRILQVDPELLKKKGAVSEEVAQQMALGAQKTMRSHWALSITGIAGPGGGTEEKPLGTVCFGLANPDNKTWAFRKQIRFPGRENVRVLSVALAMQWLLRVLEGGAPDLAAVEQK